MAEIDARLAAIAERFAAQAAETAAEIAAALGREDWSELARLSHSLAGRAGMFGYGAIGDAARSIEEAVDADLADDVTVRLTQDLLNQMAALNRA
ncbi:MAG TPA: Hpt domain-containing protein [Sphingopyxis sp.]|uniref:Hpt domain-containing protein n=1 Tax=Sphingopyxis sp. TaxID=1908224 RepID=UPI002D0F5192|nr:Hpt domain-containing protein [Sphingopyxis sp.]HWW57039.1 Hpt domain-containing protein [Sphingopyxis sp.]